MSGWSMAKLGDRVDILNHKRIPLSRIERAKRQGPYRYYGAQGVIDHIDAFLFDGEFVLVAEDGENLRSRKQPIASLVSGRFWVNNHAHILRARDGVANNRFLLHAINNAALGGFITGAAQPKLTKANLERLEFPCPPAAIQARTAALLAGFDELIEINRRRIEILKGRARSLYREWFVRFRCPGHDNVGFEESQIESLPRGWAVGRLDDHLLLARGFDLPLGERSGGDVPVVSASGVTGSHSIAKARGPAVITGRSGTIGRVMYVAIDCWPLNTTLWVKEFRLATPRSAYLLLEHLDLRTHSIGAAVPTLNRNHIHGLSVVLPTADVIAAFDRAVAPMFEQMGALEQHAEACRRARDLLLPRLVTGRLDISGTDFGDLLEPEAA